MLHTQGQMQKKGQMLCSHTFAAAGPQEARKQAKQPQLMPTYIGFSL